MGTDKKINVCHLISGDLWAGAEVQVYTLVTSLKTAPELNISAIVLNEGKLAAKLRDAGVKVSVIEESKNGFFQILILIKKALKDKEIDILHTHRYKENILGALLMKSGTVHYLIQTVHGIGEPFKGIKMLKARFYSFLDLYYTRKYCDKIQTVSFDIQNELSKKIDPDRLVTIHNAIDPTNITVTRATDEIREELGIGENQPIIGTAGRMVPVKGYGVFLDMAKIILGEKPGARFLLVGDGPLKKELEIKAQKMGLGNRVIFLGFRNDIIDIINCLDIFVISSYHEGIPMALLEAMAMKKAVVATKVGGLREVIEDGVSGLLVEPGNPQALAMACVKFLDKPEYRYNMGMSAKKRIDGEFSVEIQKDRVVILYHKVMNQR